MKKTLGSGLRKQVGLRKGSYTICKFNGSRNGDLIVGIVESVRADGHVVLRNLISQTVSTKRVDVLLERNALVRKKDAELVLKEYNNQVSAGITGTSVARALAVAIATKYEREAPIMEKDKKSEPSHASMLVIAKEAGVTVYVALRIWDSMKQLLSVFPHKSRRKILKRLLSPKTEYPGDPPVTVTPPPSPSLKVVLSPVSTAPQTNTTSKTNGAPNKNYDIFPMVSAK